MSSRQVSTLCRLHNLHRLPMERRPAHIRGDTGVPRTAVIRLPDHGIAAARLELDRSINLVHGWSWTMIAIREACQHDRMDSKLRHLLAIPEVWYGSSLAALFCREGRTGKSVIFRSGKH